MHHNILGKAVLVALVSWCAPLTATASYEPEYFLLESTPPERIQELEGEMKPEHLALLGVVLGETTLSEVKQKFGSAERIEAGHHEDLFCYRSTDPGDGTIVTFSADKHGEQRVNSFQLIAGHQPFKGQKQCASSSHISKKVATNSGIKLGLTTVALKQILDGPMVEKNGHLFLEYDYHKNTSYREQLACLRVSAGLVARFEDNKLAWVLVDRGTEGYLGPCIRSKDTHSSR